jgi:uncharacterized membrane-anchored protein
MSLVHMLTKSEVRWIHARMTQLRKEGKTLEESRLILDEESKVSPWNREDLSNR